MELRWCIFKTLHSYAEYKTETHRHRQQYGDYEREGGSEGVVQCKGG